MLFNLLMRGNIKERGKISKARTYTLKKHNISRVEWQRQPVESTLRSAKARAAFDWLKKNNQTYSEWFRDVHGWGLLLFDSRNAVSSFTSEEFIWLR